MSRGGCAKGVVTEHGMCVVRYVVFVEVWVSERAWGWLVVGIIR